MIGGRNLAKSNSLWQLVYSMNFRRSTNMYCRKMSFLKQIKTGGADWFKGFFYTPVSKKNLCHCDVKKIITGRSVVCVVNFILLFFGNWNCVYSTADCTVVLSVIQLVCSLVLCKD